MLYTTKACLQIGTVNQCSNQEIACVEAAPHLAPHCATAKMMEGVTGVKAPHAKSLGHLKNPAACLCSFIMGEDSACPDHRPPTFASLPPRVSILTSILLFCLPATHLRPLLFEFFLSPQKIYPCDRTRHRRESTYDRTISSTHPQLLPAEHRQQIEQLRPTPTSRATTSKPILLEKLSPALAQDSDVRARNSYPSGQTSHSSAPALCRTEPPRCRAKRGYTSSPCS